MLYLGYTLVLKRQELVSSSKGLMYLSDSWQEVAEWPWGAGLLAWQHPKSKLCTAMKLALVWPLALGCCFTLGEHQWSEQICTCIWKWPLLQEQITNCQKHSTLQWRTENNALFVSKTCQGLMIQSTSRHHDHLQIWAEMGGISKSTGIKSIVSQPVIWDEQNETPTINSLQLSFGQADWWLFTFWQLLNFVKPVRLGVTTILMKLDIV